MLKVGLNRNQLITSPGTPQIKLNATIWPQMLKVALNPNQWIQKSMGTPVSSANKTKCHDMTLNVGTGVNPQSMNTNPGTTVSSADET